MGILLSEIFDPRAIMLNLEGRTKEALFTELSDAIVNVHPEFDRAALLAAMWEREKKMSTGIGPGIAIPHAVCGGIDSMAGAIGISQTGIGYDALDNKPVHLVFMLAMGEMAREHHLSILNQINRLANSEALMMIKNAKNAKDVHAILTKFN